MSIPNEMSALVMHGANDFSVDQVAVPEPAQGELLCRVESTFICGTDPHILKGEYPGFWPQRFPHIMGHEWAGTVVALGAQTAEFGWKVGDRVAGTSHNACGNCMLCRRGRYNLCEKYGDIDGQHKHYGHNYHGCYADYTTHHQNCLIRVPDEMTIEEAAAVDPVSIAMHTTKRANIRPGDPVIVLGSGSMGLYVLQCAKVLGAGRVVVVGSGERLEIAKQVGADDVVDYRKVDTVPHVMELLGGRGAPSVIECAGTPAAIQNAVALTYRGGTISIIGIPSEFIPIDVKKIVLDEINFRGARANQNEQEEVVPLMMDGRIQTKPLWTHTFPLAQFDDALETLNSRTGGAVKVAVQPN